jgi:hypothetical protein
MQFTWQTGEWVKIFGTQVDQIKEDIARAVSEDRLIIYLSCPISSRGGVPHAPEGGQNPVAAHRP